MKPGVRRLTYILFLFYLVVLAWIILLKMGFSFRELDRIRIINWIPFAESSYPNGRLNLSEILNNILIFIPLGVYATMLWRGSPLPLRVAAACGVSLLFEILQYILAVGVSDVTDLLSNTAGGAAGAILSAALYRAARQEGRMDNILAGVMLAGSLAVAALAILVLAAN